MVFYFTSDVASPPVTIYMGEDKYENDDLIRWGWPEDVWFHVDKISSAHVYLRLEPGQTLDDIPAGVLDDACQLTKANSIVGNKTNNVVILYTEWENLKKTPDMEVGQVSFIDDGRVRRRTVVKRDNKIVNRLTKTKRDEKPDLCGERQKRDRAERDEKKRAIKQQKEKEKQEEVQKKQDAEMKSYTSLMKPENMTTNYDSGNDSDDFW